MLFQIYFYVVMLANDLCLFMYLSSHEAVRVGDGHTGVASVLMPVAHTEIDLNFIHTPYFRLTLTNAGTTLQCLISNTDKWIVVSFCSFIN